MTEKSHNVGAVNESADVFRALAMYLPPPEGTTPQPLPEEPRAAAEVVVKGLASGRALCAFRALGEPEGFALEGLDTERREARVGEVLTVRLPPIAGGTPMAGAIIGALLPLAAPAVLAQQAGYLRISAGAAGHSQAMTLALNKSIIIDLPSDASEVIISQPTVANAIMRSVNDYWTQYNKLPGVDGDTIDLPRNPNLHPSVEQGVRAIAAAGRSASPRWAPALAAS